MGVSGAGKTTVGTLLARDLGWAFHDADDHHPPANIERMQRGEPLSDQDRAPWLAALRALLEGTLASGGSAVLAASALRQRYREAMVPALAPAATVPFVYLNTSPETLRQRLASRRGHFMPAALLQSQLDTLEPPKDALWVDGDAEPAEIVQAIRTGLSLP